MHKEVLTKEQIKLLPIIKKFSKDFGLVGGTAIALHIGHRQSVDFDLFTNKEFDNFKVRKIVSKTQKIKEVLKDEKGHYTITVNGVNFTFFLYPFKISFSEKFDKIVNLPDLLTLSALKAYALGRRAKWKDYVDLYFVMKKHFSINEIIKRSKEIFGNEFNEKLFRSQLVYFKDIDYSERIIYLKGYKIDDKIVKRNLRDFSLS